MQSLTIRRIKKTSSNATKQCYYCSKNGHIQAECRKKKFDESNKTVAISENYQNSYSNDRRSNFQCSFCGKYGHTEDRCRHRINAAASANFTGGNTAKDVMANAGIPWCNYCRAAGHLISVCRKRIYSEQQKARIANNVSADPQGSYNNNHSNQGCSNGDQPNDFGEF